MQTLKRKIIIKALISAGLFSCVSLLMRKDLLAWGILLGTFSGILSFHLLARHVLASTALAPGEAKPYFFLKYLTRYAIMGAVLFLCAKINLQMFFAAAVGLLLIPIGCYTYAKQHR